MAPDHSTTGSTQKPKLKPTCTLCAASKIKCSRDKPICARCKERDLKCEYIVSKRAGRPCQSKKNADAANSASRPDSPTKAPASPPTVPHPLNTSSKQTATPSAFLTSSANDHCSTSTAMDFFNMPSMPSGRNFNPGMVGPLDMGDPFQSLTTDSFPSMDDFNGYLHDFDSLGSLPTQDLFNIDSNITTAPTSKQESTTSTQKCDCLGKAMQCLSQLRAESSKSSVQQMSGSAPTIDTVITRNRDIMKSANELLGCSCIHDEVLIVIVTLIMIQIMAWYAATVSNQTMSDDETSDGMDPPKSATSPGQKEQVLKLPTTIDGYRIDGSNHDRMAAQLVLSELHSVQRLVNKLSSEVNNSRRLSTSPVSPTQSGSSSNMDLDDSDSGPGIDTASISGETMKLLQTDLRKRLRTVSLRTMGILHMQ